MVWRRDYLFFCWMVIFPSSFFSTHQSVERVFVQKQKKVDQQKCGYFCGENERNVEKKSPFYLSINLLKVFFFPTPSNRKEEHTHTHTPMWSLLWWFFRRPSFHTFPPMVHSGPLRTQQRSAEEEGGGRGRGGPPIPSFVCLDAPPLLPPIKTS